MSSNDMTPIRSGQTFNIGSPGWLTQVQNKGDHVDVVDHADHSDMPVHIVHKIGRDGSVKMDLE